MIQHSIPEIAVSCKACIIDVFDMCSLNYITACISALLVAPGFIIPAIRQ